MKNLLFPLLITPLLFLLLYCAVRVSYSIWWKPKWLETRLKQQGISGTPYKLLTGDMKEFVKQIMEAWSRPLDLTHRIVPRVDPFTHHVVRQHGKISFFWAGTTPRLIIKDPELMKEVLSNKLGHLGKPYLNPIILILSKGLASLEGEKWAKHRRIINPAFHLEKLKGMIPVFSSSCGMLIDKWKKSVGHQGYCEVDVWPEFTNLTGDIISRAAFGSNYEEGKKVLELQKELQMLVLEAMQTLIHSWFQVHRHRFIPTKKNRRRKSLNKKITSMLRTLIQRRESTITRAEISRDDDLLGLLLQSSNQEISPDNASSMETNRLNTEEVIEECKLFYLAGHETTSCWLTWMMVVLAMHPNWQEKARKEVQQICGKNDPDFEAISRLKVVTMVLYEVLRLYPPVIAHYQHAYEETKIGDMTLPAGVDLTLPTLLIHHDPELWGDDAEEFRPERFREGISKAAKDQLAFFPFGWGPRTCIGQNFAMIEAKVVMAMILQHFSFELSPSYTHAPHTVLTLQPQRGAQILLCML